MKRNKIIAAIFVIPIQVIFAVFCIWVIISIAPILAWLSFGWLLLVLVNGLIPAYNSSDDYNISEALSWMWGSFLFSICFVIISLIAYYFGYDPTEIVTKALQ